MGRGISGFAFAAFCYSRALSVVLRPVAAESRHIIKTLLLCVGLVTSSANGEPLSPDPNAQSQPTPLRPSVGAPVLGEAENATDDANPPER